MKVTALIPDELIQEVKDRSGGKNVTEALIIVLNEWVAGRKLRAISSEIKKTPLKFRSTKALRKIRKLNRTS